MNEYVMPHAVRVETDSTFDARKVRARHRRSDFGGTAIFRSDGRNYVVGEEALQSGKPTRVTGPEKLRKGYLEILARAAFQKLLPDGHKNIIVACAHTTNSVPYIDAMAGALGGIHKTIGVDGREVKHTVRAMIPWDEPAGGLLRFMTRPYAEYNSEDIRVGHKILVVDIGGKFTQMTPAIILAGHKVQVLWNESHVVNIGIQDIMKELNNELTSLHPEMFRVKTIPQSIMQEALQRGGVTTIRNREYDVSQAVMNATGILINQVDTIYRDEIDSGLDLNHIIVTGGGGGMLFRVLVQEVLKHDFVYLADDPATINLANLRGGEYAASVWVTENWSKISKTGELAVVIFDPGNSDLKFKLMTARNGNGQS